MLIHIVVHDLKWKGLLYGCKNFKVSSSKCSQWPLGYSSGSACSQPAA